MGWLNKECEHGVTKDKCLICAINKGEVVVGGKPGRVKDKRKAKGTCQFCSGGVISIETGKFKEQIIDGKLYRVPIVKDKRCGKCNGTGEKR